MNYHSLWSGVLYIRLKAINLSHYYIHGFYYIYNERKEWDMIVTEVWANIVPKIDKKKKSNKN